MKEVFLYLSQLPTSFPEYKNTDSKHDIPLHVSQSQVSFNL